MSVPTQSTPSPASIADYRQLAAARLPPHIWHYLESGAGNGLTLEENERAFARRQITPRLLANVRGGHTRLQLFGHTLEHPLLLAPIAYQRLFHADGEIGSTAAADAQGSLAVISSLASQTLPDIAHAATRPQWFQLYWQGTREASLQLAQRALQSGASAIVFTADAPIKQAALQLPDNVRAVNLDPPQPVVGIAPGQSQVFDGWMAQAPNWDDLAWLREQLSEPLLLKGVLAREDARHALSLGIDGLIVSNHGGRVLDGTPASIDALAGIRLKCGKRLPILLDSGIRSGTDAFKALAAGATAVLVGRPYIWGLACAGAFGVAHVLRLMRDELEMTMALTGCRTLSDIGKQGCR